jgi:hypothetical protein
MMPKTCLKAEMIFNIVLTPSIGCHKKNRAGIALIAFFLTKFSNQIIGRFLPILTPKSID